MARLAVELDFFNMEKQSNMHAKLHPTTTKLESGITFGDIQSAISFLPLPSLPRANYPPLTDFSPTLRLCCGSENGKKIAPLTIFYNGTVAVFDVSSDEANDILKFAERLKIMDAFSSRKQLFMETLSGDLPLARRNSLLRFLENRKESLLHVDLPLARRNSLLRFLEKRKERLTMVSPYGFPQPPIYGSLGRTAS